MIISIEIFRKYIWQNPTPFQDLKKKTQQTRTRRELPQPDKGIYKNPTANITLNGERMKAFPLR